jgi:YggT family protein
VGALYNLIFLVLQLFQFILLARVLLSWFPNIDRSNPIIQLLYDITEPVLKPIREMLPQTGMIDLSPMIVFLLIYVLMQLLRVMA